MSVSVGEIVEGTVSDIMNYGAFVKLNDGKTGLVHISEVSKDFVSYLTSSNLHSKKLQMSNSVTANCI